MTKEEQLFHRLWAQAKDSPSYNKAEWMEFQNIMEARLYSNKEAVDERSPFEQLKEAVVTYIIQHGLSHDDGCPEDDDCECRAIRVIERALTGKEK